MSTHFSKVLFEMHADVAVITLNDPDSRNALSRQIVSEVFKALELSTATAARAIVIASSGPTFCAGANIDDLKDGWMERADPLTDPALLFKRLVEDPRIVIAAVQGGALGGGFELSLSCDLVVAAETAWFALPEVSRGVIPNTGLALLQRMVGSRTALELTLTGRRLSSDEGVSRAWSTLLSRASRSLKRQFRGHMKLSRRRPLAPFRPRRSTCMRTLAMTGDGCSARLPMSREPNGRKVSTLSPKNAIRILSRSGARWHRPDKQVLQSREPRRNPKTQKPTGGTGALRPHVRGVVHDHRFARTRAQ